MAQAGSLWVKLGLRDKEFNSKLTKAQVRTKKFSSQVTKLGAAIGVGFGVIALVQFTKKLIAVQSEFSSMMSRVKALTGATDEMSVALNKQAQILGRETQFTAVQAAEAMTFLAQAGLDVNQIYTAMPNALELAAAGQISLAEAADISTNVMSAYGLQAEDLGRVNDIIANTSTKANTNVREFAEAFKMVGPIAKSTKQSIESVSASIGLLANAGIKGTMAGTALRTMMSKLIKPTGDAIKILEKFGIITLDEVTGNLRPLNDILIDMKEAGMGTADMFEIFDLRAAGAATVLKEASGSFEEFVEKVGVGGTAARIAAQQMDNLKGDILRLESAWEGMFVSLGEGSDGFMRSIAQMATSLINTLTPSVETTFDALEKLKTSVTDLEDTLPGLLEEYEKLSGKAKRTEEENEKLREVMDKIAGIVPTAVTAWNDHGEALAINVTEAGKFLEVQKALLNLKNAEEIEKQKDSLEGYAFAVKSLTRELNEGRDVMVGNSLQAFKLSGEEIEENRKKIEEYNAQIKQTELILAGLTGEYEKYGVIVPKTTEQTKAEKEAQEALAKEIEELAKAKAKQLEIEFQAKEAAKEAAEIAQKEIELLLKKEEAIRAVTAAQFEAMSDLISGGPLASTEEGLMIGELLNEQLREEIELKNQLIEIDALRAEATNEFAGTFIESFETMKGGVEAWSKGLVDATAQSGAGLRAFGNEMRRAAKESLSIFVGRAVMSMVANAVETASSLGPWGFLLAPVLGALAAASANSLFDALVPSFQTGTDFVPFTGMAQLHKGEAVLTAQENKARTGGMHITGELVARGEDLVYVFDEAMRKIDNTQ